MSKTVNKISDLISVNKSEVYKNIKKYKSMVLVIKYGGSAMVDPKLSKSFSKDIKIMIEAGVKPIIVHGGGPQINHVLKLMGIKSEFHNGLRITNKETFDVVEMVLAGTLNKEIVKNFSIAGINALGISGCDCKLIKAKKYKLNTKIDLGFVGKPFSLNNKHLLKIIAAGFVPLIAPIGYNSKGIKYNINADLTAGFIASKIKARRLLMLTDVKGVIDQNGKLITELKLKEVTKLISSGVIYGGMIPKVQNCIESVREGVKASVILDGKVKHALLKELFSDKGVGTLFRK